MTFENGKADCLHKLVSNTRKRFEVDSLSALEHLYILLNPARLDTSTEGLPMYGEESLDFYGKAQQVGDTEVQNIINPECTKYFLKSLSSKSFPQVLSSLCTQSLSILVQLLSVSPVTSVYCVTAFSAQIYKKKSAGSVSLRCANLGATRGSSNTTVRH